MDLVLAVLLGALIGVALGALGGGGSILTVPALVYLLGEPAQAATTGSLVIVGVTAVIGTLGHARSQQVRWRVGAGFGLVGVAASLAGTALNHAVAPDLLLLVFAGIMVVAAVAMVRRHTTRQDGGGEQSEQGTAVRIARITAAGVAVGFLTGFLGVGGGFLVVPVLVVVFGFDMPVAVGTSLLVIALNAGAAFVARTGSETFHWAVIVPVAAAAVVGSLAGKTIAARVPERVLTRAFAALLFIVAAYTGVRSAAALL